MLYTSYFTVAVAAVLSLQRMCRNLHFITPGFEFIDHTDVAAVPLEVKMGDGNAANKQTIQDTMPLGEFGITSEHSKVRSNICIQSTRRSTT